jgi:hypothetical protein
MGAGKVLQESNEPPAPDLAVFGASVFLEPILLSLLIFGAMRVSILKP